MTSDFIRLNLTVQTVNIKLEVLNLEWPPPEYIHVQNGGAFAGLTQAEVDDIDADELPHVMVRTSYSSITDEQIAEMSHVARGAEYHYLVKR